MLRVGLTGSIGVGKSFVAGVFAELGCHVIDADEIAREVVAPGSLGLSSVIDSFGSDVLRADGTLDRARLSALVFADEVKRKLLNSILHPQIIVRQDQKLKEVELADPRGIAVVDAALMIESGSYKRFDKLVVVHCRPDVQLQRLVVRDGISPEEAKRRINAQFPQEEKMKFADYLIETSEGFDAARKLTEKVFEELRHLAGARVVRNGL